MIELPWFIGRVSAYEIKDRRVRSCTLAEQIKKFNLYLIICIPLFCEYHILREVFNLHKTINVNFTSNIRKQVQSFRTKNFE